MADLRTASAAVTGLERVVATRYVVPLREGGSLPGLVEASDDGIYVLKFRGAGQGVKVLVAEIIVGELARRLDIAVPRMVLVDLDVQIARYEADEEVQDLLSASVGLNLGIDFLPGSFGYDGSHPPPPDLATRILWLDAFTLNVDRDLDQPQPACLAPAYLGHRPWRRALRPPRLAVSCPRPWPLRRYAVRRLHARAARSSAGPSGGARLAGRSPR